MEAVETQSEGAGKARRRYLFFIPNLQQGGTEGQILSSSTSYPPRFEPVLCVYHADDVFWGARCPPGQPAHDLGVRRMNLGALDRLTEILRREKPDILHSFRDKANFWARWAGARAGVPITVTSCRNRMMELRYLTTEWFMSRKSRLHPHQLDRRQARAHLLGARPTGQDSRRLQPARRRALSPAERGRAGGGARAVGDSSRPARHLAAGPDRPAEASAGRPLGDAGARAPGALSGRCVAAAGGTRPRSDHHGLGPPAGARSAPRAPRCGSWARWRTSARSIGRPTSCSCPRSTRGWPTPRSRGAPPGFRPSSPTPPTSTGSCARARPAGRSRPGGTARSSTRWRRRWRRQPARLVAMGRRGRDHVVDPVRPLGKLRGRADGRGLRRAAGAEL